MKNPEKVKEKEQKELARLQREQSKPKLALYLPLLLVFMVLLRMLDEFASNGYTALQSAIVTEFFVVGQGVTFQEGLSTLSLVSTPMTLLAIVATLLLPLSDRFGRKPILLTSAVGIVMGMLVIFVSGNFSVYMIGYAMVSFFISFDMHQLYLVEVAPSNKRASWQALAAFFAQMAIAMIGVLRLFNTDNGNLSWRNIYLFPTLVGVVTIIFLFAFVRESEVFVNQRIAYLKSTPEERARKAEEEKKKDKDNNGGLGKAFKFIFKDKQMRWVIISLLLFRLAIPAFASYNESIMATNNMDTDSVSIALIFLAIGCGIIRLVAGPISDKLGRKKASVIFGITSIVTLILFIIAARGNWAAPIVGLIVGFSSGGYWAVGDQIGLMMNESAPTNIRGSVTAAAGLLQTVVAIVAMIFAGIMIASVDLSIFCVGYGIVILGIATVCLITKIKDTTGVELETLDK